MQQVRPRNFAEWRQGARALLNAQVPPDAVIWSDQREPSLFEEAGYGEPPSRAGTLRVSPELIQLLELVALYRDPARWEIMYRLAWRIANENRRLLEDAADPQVRGAQQMAKSVRRDLHKMHAFVRFRKVAEQDGERYVSWFEPEHYILERGAGFFVRRFGSMNWMIATPECAALWDQRELVFVDAPRREDLPGGDDLESMWRVYYRSICNAARINPAAMQREMPQKYWKLLPEAAEIGLLLRDSAQRVALFDDQAARAQRERHEPIQSAGPALPAAGDARSISLLACRRCDLWRHATQPVPGEGPQTARLMVVGEQPGDQEDLQGRAFVGPAGSVLDNALQAAGIDRATLYLTNAVKHFKWTPRGKRRMHKTPAQQEVAACQHWLLQELASVKPAVVVALGATALRSLSGWSDTIEHARQQSLHGADGSRLIATYHPAAILRAPEGERERLMQCLVSDLQRAAQIISAARLEPPPTSPSAAPATHP
jgi:DNA polymerase